MNKCAVWIKGKGIYSKSAGVQALLGVSRESISQYAKKGMPFKLQGRARIYDLNKILEWRIDQESQKIFESISDTEDVLGEDFNSMPMDQLNRAMKAYGAKKLKHESKIKEIQEKVELGLYIPADKMDKNMAELATIFISILKEMRQVLPTKIENMDAETIENILDTYFENMVKRLQKEAKSV